jgi:hypothetical protein
MKPKAYSYIRFSTTPQEKTHSLERQEELREEYLQKHPDVTLDTSQNLQDLGLSAYKGIHRTKGALGVFLKMVEDGLIPIGSILIVENLDRLSRERPLTALNMFISIIDAGITVVTLDPEEEFTVDSLNHDKLAVAVNEIIRSNKESERKSALVKKGWRKLRAKVVNGEQKMTRKCPAWLIPEPVIKDKKIIIDHYNVNRDAVIMIKEIYRLKLEGMGSEKIARELNKKGLWMPPGRKSSKPNKVDLEPRWRKSYVDKILRNNRAVLGEGQLYKLEDGKRVADGEPIPEYYGKGIIDETTFNKVQAMLEPYDKTKKHAGGRNGNINSLFGNLAYCMACGSPLTPINKGNSSNGGQYLACDKDYWKLNGGCSKSKIRYSLFEETVLKCCIGLDVLNILLSGKRRISELANLNGQLHEIQSEIKTMNYPKKIERLIKSIESTDNQDVQKKLKERISKHIVSQKLLEMDEKAILTEIDKITKTTQGAEEQLKDTQELINKMAGLEGQERIDLRIRLRYQLRRLIKRIETDLDINQIIMFFHSGQSKLINIGVNGELETVTRTKPPVKKNKLL